MLMKILIDNGHGKETPGKRSPLWPDGAQLFEWKYAREIAQRVVDELKARGVDAERIVTEDVDIPLSERCRRANSIAAAGISSSLLVSIHNNAANGTARGWEIHTYTGNSKSDEYAAIFWNTAKTLLPPSVNKMRGDHSDGDPDFDSNFAILRDTVCPAVLTENLFMDNEADCRYLLSETGKQVITSIHVQSILKITGK